MTIGTRDFNLRGMKKAGERGHIKLRDFDLQLKAIGADAAPGTFEGYGSVYGVEDSYNEIVAPGAFTESLAELTAKGRKVPVLWAHMGSEPIGVYDEITEDEQGLFVKGRLLIDEVARAKEIHALIRANAVSGLSIGYWIRESSYDEKTNIRTLTKLDLIEVSLVTFPANDEARVEAVKFKLANGELPTIREFEKLLRDAGFSKSEARRVVRSGYSETLGRRDAGGATTKAAIASLRETFRGLELPKFGDTK